MNDPILKEVFYPLLLTFGSVLAVALGNLIVKSLGRSGKTPARLQALEQNQQATTEALVPLQALPEQIQDLATRQASSEALNRLTLRAMSNLTSAMKASLEAQSGYNNGNVKTAISRMTQLEAETQEFLIDAAVPQETRS